MENLQLEEWVLQVDVQKTKDFYATVDYNNEELMALNYIQVCSFCDDGMLQFFDQIGVDLLKPTNLHSLPVEHNSMVMYTGSYHAYGTRIEGDLDGWDIVIGHHCLSLTENNSVIPANMVGEVIEISFEVVLPWMLEEPVPEAM